MNDLNITLAAIRAVAEQSASISCAEGAAEKLPRTPRSRAASPAASSRGVSERSASPALALSASASNKADVSAALRSAPAIGKAEESCETAACRPPRPNSAGQLGSIPKDPVVHLPTSLQVAVQQTLEFAAAATLPWESKGANGSPDRQSIEEDEATSSVGSPISYVVGSQESHTDPEGALCKGKVTSTRFKEIVNRLHSTAEQYENNRQQRLLQKAQDEAATASQAKPTINKRSAQMTRNMEPLAIRTEKQKAKLEKKQEGERLKRIEQEMEEIQPCPRINPKSQEICREARNHGINSQYQWDKERRQRLEVEQEHRREDELKDCTFKPQLSALSEKLLRQSSNSSNSRDVHERLHRQAAEGKRGTRPCMVVRPGNVSSSSELERSHAASQGTANAVSFEDFMGLEPTATMSNTPRSSLPTHERPSATKQAISQEALLAPKRRPNPLTQGILTLQEERRRKQQAELQQRHMTENLQWEDEQEAVNRTVKYLNNGNGPHWEEDEDVAEMPHKTPSQGLRRRHAGHKEEPEEKYRTPDQGRTTSSVIAASDDIENHGAKAMSFESFMMGASLGQQLYRDNVAVQSPPMDNARPLRATSTFLPADLGYPLRCSAEHNVVEYNARFRDVFSAITGDA